MRKIFIISMITALLFFNSANADEWIDNWIQQSTSSMPNTYKTQQRGYVSGGKLSVRYKQSNDHLISVSPPSFKKGCGGIDMFLGSVSYLDADRLKAKFENISTNAIATYMFDLALNVVCEPCAKELKSLEAVIDRLNQLQIDDCKASKAMVAYMKNETGQGDSQQNSEAISDFLVSSGMQDLYNDVTDESNNKDTKAVMDEQGITKEEMISGCPEEMKKVFFTEGTLLENMAGVMGIDAGQVKLMQSLVGDVYISADLEYAALAPCAENNPKNIDAIIYGDLYTRDGEKCKPIGTININGTNSESLYEYSRRNILEISDAIATNGGFSEANETFIQTIPEPILVMSGIEIMRMGNDTDTELIADKYAYTSSLVIAYSLMRDLYNDINNLLYRASIVSFNQKGSDSGENLKCAKELKAEAQRLAANMKKSAMDYSRGISAEYQRTLDEVMESYNYAKQVAKMKNQSEFTTISKITKK